MISIDSDYDNAMRNAVDPSLYDKSEDAKNLHLIGATMDNTAADNIEQAIAAADYVKASIALFGFVL